MGRDGSASRRATGAMAVALAALVAALGGAAYAGTRIGTGDLENSAVTTKKIRAKAVTTAKLEPAERSQGFVTRETGRTTLPAGTTTTVATLDLPRGRFILDSSVVVSNATATANAVNCALIDDGTGTANGNASLDAQAGSQTISLTAASNGGRVTLSCGAATQAQAVSGAITAVRVASIKSE